MIPAWAWVFHSRMASLACSQVATPARGVYSGKPRPVVIVQDDRFNATASVTVCPLTTNPIEAPLFRLPVEPSEPNGLDQLSFLMVDKVTTTPRDNLGDHLGRLGDSHVLQLNGMGRAGG